METSESPPLEVCLSCEVLDCKDMLFSLRLSVPVSSSSAPEASRSTSKTIISQLNRLDDYLGPIVPVVVGCQT